MARPARLHALVVAILVAGAAAQAAFEAALASEDHCQAGGGAPCALSARQLRGEAVSGEGGRGGCGRRRCAEPRKRSYRIGREELQGSKEALQRSLALRGSVKKRLDMLERAVDETYKMVVPEAPSAIVGTPSRRAGRQDQQPALRDGQRRGGLAPRAAAARDCYGRLQRALDAEWRRQARCSRLDRWTRRRLEDPSTPPFKAEPEELAVAGEGGGDERPEEPRARGLEIELELEIEVEGKVELDLELELELELRFCGDEEEDGKDGGQAAASEALGRPEVHAAGGRAAEAHMKDELDEAFQELAAVVEATAKRAAETRRLVAQSLNVTAAA